MAAPLNLLFIIADQFRADSLSAVGHPQVRTPNLDALAAEGTLFTHCYNQTAPCGPSRMCIYTGRYLCSTRAVDNMTPLRDAEENYGQWLRRAGRDPGLMGYNDYAVDPAILPPDDPRRTSLRYDNVLPGFERVYYHEYDSDDYFAHLRQQGYPESLLSHQAIHTPQLPPQGPGPNLPQHYPAQYQQRDSECHYLTDRALDYLKNRPAEPGWVLSLNYIKPHPPNICCPPYHDLYDPDATPAATRRADELDPVHPYMRLMAPGHLRDELHLRQFRACYYGMINEVDDNLGRVFDYLRQSGQWDNTLIVFTSDHGEYLGDHYMTGKGHFHDPSLRIPCIVRDPNPDADPWRGRQTDTLVESIDLAPTILEALGEQVPSHVQGRSLLPLLRGGEYQNKDAVFHEFDYRTLALRADPDADPDNHLLWVVRDRQFKYVHFADESIPPLLFDLNADPGELDNLAADPAHAATQLRLCQRLLRWRMYNEDQRQEHWALPYRGF
jgi:arylsulfatase A-like enzyme